MPIASDSLPDDIAALKALLLARDGEVAQLRTTVSTLEQALSVRSLEIEQLKLQLAKLKRMQFGRKSEKLDRKIEELETRLEDLVAEEGAGDQQAGSTAPRSKSERRPLPEHLMREERVLEPQEQACAQCGGELKPLGEDVSEQLDIIDSAFKVIRHIRRKKACACCDHIAQAAAPRRAGRSSAVSPVPACWRKSWWPSMPTTSHCTASRPSTRGTAWNWTARRWGVGWAPAAPSCAPWS